MKLAAILAFATLLHAADPAADLLNALPFRNLGPFRAGAWVSTIAIPAQPANLRQRVIYAGARTGGVWKTSNAGTTWENITDAIHIASVGALAVAPSDANLVWLGSGDNSVTRSAYPGTGMYRSTDAGKTWQSAGLTDSQHIARIVIHPTNPNIVWVAALGHLFSANSERGVYKTADGGRTWQRVLHAGDTTGAVDLIADPRDPNVLYAALYQALRHPWRLDDGGPESGVYKSTDGGATWKRLTSGLPTGPTGRTGLDLCRSHPDTVYALIDNSEAKRGEVYRSDDAGATWRRMSADADDVSRKAGYSFNQLRVDPNDRERVFITGSNMIASRDGGKTWAGLRNFGGGRGSGQVPDYPFSRAFGDFRDLWIDATDSAHMIAASDGGVFVSWDGGRTCDHLVGLRTGEVYAIGLDMDQPYHIYAGLQDHENWRGPINGPNGSVGFEDWVTTGIGDGMYNEPDPTGRWLYNTQEFGTLARVDLTNHSRTVIAPTHKQDQPYLRFNWTAPVRISPHDPATIYAGAQILFRSKDRGDHWEEISPDLTSNDPQKISVPRGSIQFCTITTISESPAQAGVIWVGTDDGKVQVTRDAGAHWSDVSPGPVDAWVSRVYASKFAAGTAYITKTRRRFDDFRPYLYRTTDFGAHWTELSAGLPAALNVIVEDTAENLYVGTDVGIYSSFDRGAHWREFRSNMPHVPVHDLLVHPREGDLVAGTYGRGIWVTNVVPLRGYKEDAVLLPIRPFTRRMNEGAFGNFRLYGDRPLTTPNEPNAIVVMYYLKEAAQPALTIAGRSVPATGNAGWNRVVWPAQGVAAGSYTAVLKVGSGEYSQAVVVK
ncbi:MAG TPA: hypothetical protein VKE70_32030 [Candidatus Solibacter sp.]|nr:hypothetical protein [Candidatus Solibacter sp.]